MTTLIAEDLLVLLLDDAKGTPQTSYLDTALGGALLLELALAGAVDASGRTWTGTRVQAVPGTQVADPVLAEALAVVEQKPRAASDLVGRLGKGLRAVLAERLVARGVLQREDDRVLGLFPRTRWPEADAAYEAALRADLTAVLVQGQAPDARTGALVALLSAVDRAHRTVPHDGVPARDVRRRAKEVADGAWAASAVKDAIAASVAAITAATVATTSIATSS